MRLGPIHGRCCLLANAYDSFARSAGGPSRQSQITVAAPAYLGWHTKACPRHAQGIENAPPQAFELTRTLEPGTCQPYSCPEPLLAASQSAWLRVHHLQHFAMHQELLVAHAMLRNDFNMEAAINSWIIPLRIRADIVLAGAALILDKSVRQALTRVQRAWQTYLMQCAGLHLSQPKLKAWPITELCMWQLTYPQCTAVR